jgi:hypothetical protein
MSNKLRRKKPVCTLILGRTLGPACDFARAAILSTWPLSCTEKQHDSSQGYPGCCCCFSCRKEQVHVKFKGGFNPEKTPTHQSRRERKSAALRKPRNRKKDRTYRGCIAARNWQGGTQIPLKP